jgi:hypothetical protein
LFPFISILICTLGCLLMVTMSWVALALGPGLSEQWRVMTRGPGDRSVEKAPTLLEWDGDAVTVHPEKVRVPWAAASVNNGRNDSAFGRLLELVRKNRERQYLYVAVRPSGFGNLDPLLALIRSQQIDVGYEPIQQDRVVSLAQDRAGSGAPTPPPPGR